jgi:hypothetical protein
MGTTKKVLLVLSGLLPLLGLFSRPADPMPLIYMVFVAACLLRRRLEALVDRLPGSAACHLVIAFLLAGSLTETLAWLNSYWKAAPQPALLHPQLIPDLIVGIGFYGGWAVAWLITFRWFRFTLVEVFLVTGILGIAFEQLGAVFLLMLRTLMGNPLQSLLIGVYVLVVYGSAAGLALVPLLSRFDAPQRSRSWLRFPVVIALMITLAVGGCVLVNLGALALGGLPPKRSIVEHPFW